MNEREYETKSLGRWWSFWDWCSLLSLHAVLLWLLGLSILRLIFGCDLGQADELYAGGFGMGVLHLYAKWQTWRIADAIQEYEDRGEKVK